MPGLVEIQKRTELRAEELAAAERKRIEMEQQLQQQQQQQQAREAEQERVGSKRGLRGLLGKWGSSMRSTGPQGATAAGHNAGSRTSEQQVREQRGSLPHSMLTRALRWTAGGLTVAMLGVRVPRTGPTAMPVRQDRSRRLCRDESLWRLQPQAMLWIT